MIHPDLPPELQYRDLPDVKLDDGAVRVTLERCDDAFYRRACSIGQPMAMCLPFGLMIHHELQLGESYAALLSLTGPSGMLFDHYKGAFAFPFKLTVHRGERKHRYLLMLENFRSGIGRSLLRIQSPEQERDRAYRKLIPEELSAQELHEVLWFIEGVLEGFMETAPAWTTPFLGEVRSNLLLYGFHPVTQVFFEEEYDSLETYEAARAELRSRFPSREEEVWHWLEENW